MRHHPDGYGSVSSPSPRRSDIFVIAYRKHCTVDAAADSHHSITQKNEPATWQKPQLRLRVIGIEVRVLPLAPVTVNV
jgi:hypothetical protein